MDYAAKTRKVPNCYEIPALPPLSLRYEFPLLLWDTVLFYEVRLSALRTTSRGPRFVLPALLR